MEETAAERLYRKHQEQMKRQYEKNKETWNLKRMEKYREIHPNPRPRGRPKKTVTEPVVEISI